MYARSKSGANYQGRSKQILSNKQTQISSFKSQIMPTDVNVLNMQKGTSQLLKNMEYLRSGGTFFGIRTRRGTDLIKDITRKVWGAGTFNISNTNYFVYKEKVTGDIKYYNPTSAAITSITTGTTQTQTHFWNFNFPGGSNLYACNTTDGITKITNGFVYSTIFATGVDVFGYSNISGRLFAAIGHTVYYSAVQLKDATNTSNLESFNASTQQFKPSPDDGEGIKAVADNGQITFFFKDTGIWALINANESTDNWLIPKCNADQGTRSPKTVKYARYGAKEGFIYLASDKTLRFFNGRVERNAGTKPTLSGGDSKIISNNFTELLKSIPNSMLAQCNGIYFDRLFILNIASNGSNELDICIAIDTEKLDKFGQPYWSYYENFEWLEYIKVQNSRLYGFHNQGFISELFIKDRYVDEVPSRLSYYSDDSTSGTTKSIAIRWGNYLYPIKVSNNMVRLYDCFLGWKSEGNWSINFLIDSFDNGDVVPGYDAGIIVPLKSTAVGGSYFDFAFFDQALFSTVSGAVTQNSGTEAYGHYFKYGMYSNAINEYATIYDIQPTYQVMKHSPMSKNI